MFRLPVIVLSLLVATGTTAAQAQTSSDVHVEVADHPRVGATVEEFVNVGSVPLSVEMVTLYDGQATVAQDPWGDMAARFPAFRYGDYSPRAVMRVDHHAASGDPFAPGTRDFVFGATFKLDKVSSGSSVDNGNNIIQRGLWGDSAQYKLQAEGSKISCRVSGSAGAVLVHSSVTLVPERWYYTRCERVGSSVKLVVKEYFADGGGRLVANTGWGETGKLSWSDTGTPLAVGGKLAPSGSILRSSTDQFNGIISNPLLNISD